MIPRLDPRHQAARSRRNLSNFHLEMPWREYSCSRARVKVPILRPGTTNDSEFHTGIALEFLQVGDQLELVEARSISGGRSEVMDKNAVTAPFQLLSQKKS